MTLSYQINWPYFRIELRLIQYSNVAPGTIYGCMIPALVKNEQQRFSRKGLSRNWLSRKGRVMTRQKESRKIFSILFGFTGFFR